MRLLSASALWWLLLAAPIIFFYLFKLKRRPLIVPSVFLWQRALDELEANAPFRRLRRNLLLLLQLLALAALTLALARPLVRARALASGGTIIILDATASMGAQDEEGGSRLDRAKQLAREMIDGLEASDRAAIIECASSVVVRSPLTSDRLALASAIDEVQQTDTAASLSEAVRLAEQIAIAERDASIVIISDGGSPPIDAPSEKMPLRFVRVGRRADNIGIVRLNSRRLSAGRGHELFASIANFSDRERSAGLQLMFDGRLVDAREITIAAGGRSSVTFTSAPPSGGLAELKLDVEDDLAADNVAYAFVASARKTRVSAAVDNAFLLRALAVNPDLDARKIASPGQADFSEFDCAIVEGAMLSGALESNRPLLAINPADAPGLWATAGTRDQPAVSWFDRSHPVNSFLNYGDLYIERAAIRSTATWLKPIVTSADGGLIWAGDDGRRRVVMVGFDLKASDLPLKVEFPLLVANSIAWLVGGQGEIGDRVVRAGEPITIQSSSPAVSVTAPSGESSELAVTDGSAAFAHTSRVGIYSVSDSAPLAATLSSETESDTTPRDSIDTREGKVQGQLETYTSEREVWRWIALAALVVLALEWLSYHRRVTV
jgi:hypothetical protein